MPMPIAEHIQNLPPYTPIEPFEVLSERVGRTPEQIIKLDANENPYGVSPRTRQALAEMDFPHIYPDPESRSLRRALAAFTGASFENLLAGSGADELLDLITRFLVLPGDRVINCPPTFGMYPFDTNLNAGQIVEVPRKPDFSLDMEGIEEAVSRTQPKLIFVTSPNNPNGSLLPAEELEVLLQMELMVVLDEAYIEFADESGEMGRGLSNITRVAERENLIVLRTFSKWAGLAGLRVGFGAFPGWMMPVIWKAKQPYNVNVAASVAAMAALQDEAYLAEIVSRLRGERQRLQAGLDAVPFLQTYPTCANFILCRVTGRDAAQLKADLAEKYGIFIRYFNKPGLDDHIRISVGKPEHTDAILEAFKCML